MVRMMTRVQRLAAHPACQPPSQLDSALDYTRLSPDQRMRLADLGKRYEAVGLAGLTDTELDEIAKLVGILDRDPQP